MEKANYSEESILIVDDNPSLREILVDLLKTLGFVIKATSNGLEALKLLEENGFTFLLTDMRMPEMDGMELIREVNRSFPKVSIIAMTGYSAGYKYIDVINNGASDFIKKPFELGELEAKIKRIIDERNLREELSRLSITDSLTELFNQRHFYTTLNHEVKRADRQRHPLALILIDLDDFKAYNDTHGHLAGDEMLRDVGKEIKRWIRHGVDSGYRYGGDEFVIILIDADLKIAKEIGKRIQNSFMSSRNIRLSIGYAKFCDGMTAEDLVSEADKDLYQDKIQQK